MRVKGSRRQSTPPPLTRCRVKRLQLGWSQEKLAELANVPQPYVSSIERQRNVVPWEDLEAVGRVLGVEPGSLMEIVEVMQEEDIGHQ